MRKYIKMNKILKEIEKAQVVWNKHVGYYVNKIPKRSEFTNIHEALSAHKKLEKTINIFFRLIRFNRLK